MSFKKRNSLYDINTGALKLKGIPLTFRKRKCKVFIASHGLVENALCYSIAIGIGLRLLVLAQSVVLVKILTVFKTFKYFIYMVSLCLFLLVGIINEVARLVSTRIFRTDCYVLYRHEILLVIIVHLLVGYGIVARFCEGKGNSLIIHSVKLKVFAVHIDIYSVGFKIFIYRRLGAEFVYDIVDCGVDSLLILRRQLSSVLHSIICKEKNGAYIHLTLCIGIVVECYVIAYRLCPKSRNIGRRSRVLLKKLGLHHGKLVKIQILVEACISVGKYCFALFSRAGGKGQKSHCQNQKKRYISFHFLSSFAFFVIIQQIYEYF